MKLPHLAAICCLLTACVAVDRSASVGGGHVYTASPEGETARLRVISDGQVDVVPDSTCIDLKQPGAGRLLSVDLVQRQRKDETLDIPMGPLSRQFLRSDVVMTEVRIAANKPFAFYFQARQKGDETAATCQRKMYFVPEADKDYELLLLDDSRCMATLKWLRNQHRQYPIKLQETSECPEPGNHNR